MKTYNFFIRHKRAPDFLEILNEMLLPYVGIRFSKGYKVQVCLSDKEIAQFNEIGFYAVNLES